jgi:O-antigen ligase
LLGLASLAGIVTRRFYIAAALIVTVLLALLVVMGPVGAGEWLVQQGWMTNPTTNSWAARTEVWSRAIWASAEFPLTGMGMDIFRQSAWKMYPFFQKPFGEDLGHAHNILLQVALDLGFPG